MAIVKFVGNGRVLNGDAFVSDVKYEVRVEEQSDEDRLSGLGQQPPKCRLWGLAEGTLHPRIPYTLEMSNRRRLDFWFYGHNDISPPARFVKSDETYPLGLCDV